KSGRGPSSSRRTTQTADESCDWPRSRPTKYLSSNCALRSNATIVLSGDGEEGCKVIGQGCLYQVTVEHTRLIVQKLAAILLSKAQGPQRLALLCQKLRRNAPALIAAHADSFPTFAACPALVKPSAPASRRAQRNEAAIRGGEHRPHTGQ